MDAFKLLLSFLKHKQNLWPFFRNCMSYWKGRKGFGEILDYLTSRPSGISPMRYAFPWEDSPEGYRYWDKMNELFKDYVSGRNNGHKAKTSIFDF